MCGAYVMFSGITERLTIARLAPAFNPRAMGGRWSWNPQPTSYRLSPGWRLRAEKNLDRLPPTGSKVIKSPTIAEDAGRSVTTSASINVGVRGVRQRRGRGKIHTGSRVRIPVGRVPTQNRPERSTANLDQSANRQGDLLCESQSLTGLKKPGVPLRRVFTRQRASGRSGMGPTPWSQPQNQESTGYNATLLAAESFKLSPPRELREGRSPLYPEGGVQVVEVTLTDCEQKIARYMAKRREAYARGHGIEDKKVGRQSGEDGDLNGFGAELAFARISNTYPDLSVDHDTLPDADVLYRTGHTIDVKVTKYKKGHLIAQPGKSKSQVDLYACMIGTFPTYRLAGFMSRKELIREGRLKDFGYEDNRAYAARQDELSLVESAEAEPLVQEFLRVFKGDIAAVRGKEE